MGTKILILCTGNSCRSQMAEGFAKAFAPNATVESAGTRPAPRVNPTAVSAMKEIGIDISGHRPKNVSRFLAEPWDCVLTVCGGANDECPVFAGTVKRRVHIPFDDPSETQGTEEQIRADFARVRDQIAETFKPLIPELTNN